MKRYMTIPEIYRKMTKNSLRKRYEIPEKRFCNCCKELNYLHNMILGILPRQEQIIDWKWVACDVAWGFVWTKNLNSCGLSHRFWRILNLKNLWRIHEESIRTFFFQVPTSENPEQKIKWRIIEKIS